MKRAIHWFRRDLRLTDNAALTAADRQAEQVVPVFIVEDALRTGPDVGAARLAFLLDSAAVLKERLHALGYTLIVRQGRSEEEIPKLCRELRAEAVFCNRRYEPYALARDARVHQSLHVMGVSFVTFKDAVVWEDRDVLSRTGVPYTIFTPYAKTWRSKTVPRTYPSLRRARQPAPQAPSLPLPSDPAELGHPLVQTRHPAGEKAALEALDKFLSGPVYDYANTRDLPEISGTSKLSPHFRAGTIGVRTVLAELSKARKVGAPNGKTSCDVFLNELIWREFYLQILANYPHVMKGCFRRELDRIKWPGGREHFAAWRDGQTGFPIVDAAMRCLKVTGWMHNRLRMITAMFLVKDLLVNWQEGERYFMTQLVDGDMAANNGGWQWCAGTGTDAAPYFRIFNPLTQAERFDPEGAFIRRWVPELANLPPGLIHQPWQESRRAVSRYPKPIVVHESQREKFLAVYKAARAKK